MPLSIATDVSQQGDRPNRGLRMARCDLLIGLIDRGLIYCFDAPMFLIIIIPVLPYIKG
jgi:hypothetical protein